MLALFLVAAKAALLGLPKSWLWPFDLMLVSWQDVLLAVGAGFCAQFAARATSARPLATRLVRTLFIAFCILCTLYAVIAAGAYQYFQRPLSYQLLGLIRDLSAVRSSIGARITLPIVIALIAMPALLLALARWPPRRQSVPISLLAVVGVWIIAGWCQGFSRSDFRKPRLAISPHVELVRSTISGWTGRKRVSFPDDYPAEDESEFRSVGARGGAPQPGYQPPANAARPKNVIVIILESVGTKYLSVYGGDYDTTPKLVAEAANTLVFDNCYAQAPYTYSSFMALNFSIYPGLPWLYAPWAGRPCPPSLAAVLGPQGWRTAYFHNGDLDWEDCRWLLDGQGFDQTLGYQDFNAKKLSSWGIEDRHLFEKLKHWIAEEPGRPFLAVCWTDQTHDPYAQSPGNKPIDFFGNAAPPPLAADLGRYLNNVHQVDRLIGQLLAELRLQGLAENTLIAITGDHGEAFRDPHDQRGHSLTIFEEDIHVPLLLWSPTLFSPGRRESRIASHIDINPTILDILGINPPGDWQGHSVFDAAHPPRAYFMTNIDEYLFGLREERWKFIFDATSGTESLFDLQSDPDELRNLAATEQQRCQRFQQRLAAWVSFEEGFLRGEKD